MRKQGRIRFAEGAHKERFLMEKLVEWKGRPRRKPLILNGALSSPGHRMGINEAETHDSREYGLRPRGLPYRL